MSARTGNWMQTFTGRQFWPVDPRAADIDIIDIAAALAKMCRYGGHTLRFYSVAEHSVLMARVAREYSEPLDIQRAALLHDASEAYLGDVIRPVKGEWVGYRAAEARLMQDIAERFDFPWPLPAAVKMLDERILVDEMRQAMAPPAADWGLSASPLNVRIEFWTPERAFSEFMIAFARVREGL